MNQSAPLNQITKPTTLEQAWRIAYVKIANIKPHRIYGEPRPDDARALQDDLEALWRIVDPLIEAYGEYASENFHGINKKLFSDQLRGALEGNATFELEQAADQLSEDLREEAYDSRRRRGFRW